MADEEIKPERCASTRTVQLGRMSAVDLRCTRIKYAHGHVMGGRPAGHGTSRMFDDVTMFASWPGDWEPEEEEKK